MFALILGRSPFQCLLPLMLRGPKRKCLGCDATRDPSRVSPTRKPRSKTEPLRNALSCGTLNLFITFELQRTDRGKKTGCLQVHSWSLLPGPRKRHRQKPNVRQYIKETEER